MQIDTIYPVWQHPPQWPAVTSTGVHVWCAGVTVPQTLSNELVQLLSLEERDRATRFRFEQDRMRYVVSHTILRTILASYLQRPPNELQFQTTSAGKPFLLPAGQTQGLKFNMSHTRDLVMYVIAWNGSVGIDIEYIHRPRVNIETLANHYFSPEETKAILSLPAEERPKPFFRIWTRKEAYLKATGEGIAGLHESVPEAGDWSIHSFIPRTDFIGAVCIEGHARDIEAFYDYNDGFQG